MSTNRSLIIIIFILVLSNAFFAYKYFNSREALSVKEGVKEKMAFNVKVVDFTSLFIKEVLQAENEVDFETRLKLENAVRDLKDEQIKAEWEKFTKSKTEIEAQTSVKNLLAVLIGKIQK